MAPSSALTWRAGRKAGRPASGLWSDPLRLVRDRGGEAPRAVGYARNSSSKGAATAAGRVFMVGVAASLVDEGGDDTNKKGQKGVKDKDNNKRRKKNKGKTLWA